MKSETAHTISQRKRIGAIAGCFFFGSLAFAFIFLCVLMFRVFAEGMPWLSLHFFTNVPSRHAERAGVMVALWGTMWVTCLSVILALPTGVAAALYLEEYANDSRWMRIVRINIANLAGVPSIIYGMLGLMLFVEWLALGRTVIAGALTMAALVLPVIITSTQEAIKGIPLMYRDGAYALGATKGQVILRIVLPLALPGIITGNILGVSRIIGETAPMIAIAALVYITVPPTGLFSRFTVLPIQIYDWISRPQEDFQGLAAAGIIVLLGVLFLLNGIAAFLRNRFQKKSEE